MPPVPNVKTTRSRSARPAASVDRLPIITQQIPHFVAGEYLATNLFSVSSTVPSISEESHRQTVEHIKGQIRAVDLSQNNLTLNRQLLKAEGMSFDCQNEALNNQVKLQDIRTTGVRLQQSVVKTQIEESELGELHHDLTGHTEQAALKQQTWKLKLDGIRETIDYGRQLLELRREEMTLDLLQRNPRLIPG